MYGKLLGRPPGHRLRSETSLLRAARSSMQTCWSAWNGNWFHEYSFLLQIGTEHGGELLPFCLENRRGTGISRWCEYADGILRGQFQACELCVIAQVWHGRFAEGFFLLWRDACSDRGSALGKESGNDRTATWHLIGFYERKLYCKSIGGRYHISIIL